MSDLINLLNMKSAMRNSFRAVKASPLDLDKLMAHVAQLSKVVESLITDKMVKDRLIFDAHMEMLSAPDLPKFDGTVGPAVANTKPWIELGATVLAGSGVNLAEVPPHKLKFWSDTHFYQEKIIQYTNRPFANAEEMNEKMCEYYNSEVEDDDVVVWVGDVSFGGTNKTNEFLDRFKGYKILVVGNHDIDRHTGKLKQFRFDEIHTSLQFDQFVVTHHPWKNHLPEQLINIHGHVHNHNLNLDGHINVSCEVVGYRPASLANLLANYGN